MKTKTFCMVSILCALQRAVFGVEAFDVIAIQRDSLNTTNVTTYHTFLDSGFMSLNWDTTVPEPVYYCDDVHVTDQHLVIGPNIQRVDVMPIVAISGCYSDLLGKPVIPDAPMNADWLATGGALNVIHNKPAIGTSAHHAEEDFDVAGAASSAQSYAIARSHHTGTQSADTITNGFGNRVYTFAEQTKLAGVATGATVQVKSDWTASGTIAEILNRPSLATVATSGAYTDLSGKPSLATVATTGAYADLSGKPTLGTAAAQASSVFATAGQGAKADAAFPAPTGTTAQYLRGDGTPLTFPSIPAAQVQSDWNASSGLGVVLNKPTLTSGTVTSVIAGTGLSGGTITSTGTVSMPNTGTAGTYSGVTTDAQGRITAGTTRSFNNAVTLTLVTSATGQGGVQVDASRDAEAHYSVATSTTATIGGASTVTAVLEIADTNSATAGDWTTLAKVATGQTITLAIALQSVQTNTLNFGGVVPAGKYRRVRYSTTGTASCTYDSGQEVKL